MCHSIHREHPSRFLWLLRPVECVHLLHRHRIRFLWLLRPVECIHVLHRCYRLVVDGQIEKNDQNKFKPHKNIKWIAIWFGLKQIPLSSTIWLLGCTEKRRLFGAVPILRLRVWVENRRFGIRGGWNSVNRDSSSGHSAHKTRTLKKCVASLNGFCDPYLLNSAVDERVTEIFRWNQIKWYFWKLQWNRMNYGNLLTHFFNVSDDFEFLDTFHRFSL